MRGFLGLFFFFCMLVCAASALAREVTLCYVTNIVDGNTFSCLPGRSIKGAERNGDKTLTVKLKGIESPEKYQPCNRQAKENLRSLIRGKIVRLEIKNIDRYGRLSAYVFERGKNINIEQLRLGYAWTYLENIDGYYFSDFYEAEKEAKKLDLCIWKETNPLLPWVRKEKMNNGENKDVKIPQMFSGDINDDKTTLKK